jgi:hypothetical protein
MRLRSIGRAAVISVLLTLTAPAGADEFTDCVRRVAAQDLAAKRDYQASLRALVVNKRPDFAALAKLNMDLQIALAEARKAQLDYLSEHQPKRIDTAEGLSKFTNFDWSTADDAKLTQADSAYRQLNERITGLKETNNGHPDWPAMRELFRGDLAQSRGFKALMAGFATRQNAVESMLGGCRAK